MAKPSAAQKGAQGAQDGRLGSAGNMRQPGPIRASAARFVAAMGIPEEGKRGGRRDGQEEEAGAPARSQRGPTEPARRLRPERIGAGRRRNAGPPSEAPRPAALSKTRDAAASRPRFPRDAALDARAKPKNSGGAPPKSQDPLADAGLGQEAGAFAEGVGPDRARSTACC